MVCIRSIMTLTFSIPQLFHVQQLNAFQTARIPAIAQNLIFASAHLVGLDIGAKQVIMAIIIISFRMDSYIMSPCGSADQWRQRDQLMKSIFVIIIVSWEEMLVLGSGKGQLFVAELSFLLLCSNLGLFLNRVHN